MVVGFPGETEADFEQTLSLLDEVEYDSIFCFKYSPRPNTPSLQLEDPIPEPVDRTHVTEQDLEFHRAPGSGSRGRQLYRRGYHRQFSQQPVGRNGDIRSKEGRFQIEDLRVKISGPA